MPKVRLCLSPTVKGEAKKGRLGVETGETDGGDRRQG